MKSISRKFREIDVTNHNWTISLTAIFLFTDFSCQNQNRNIPKYRYQCVVVILRCCSFFFSFSLLNNTLKGEETIYLPTHYVEFHCHYFPFYHINKKKVRLLLYIFPEFFFAIKIHSFHAALNSDAPRLEFVLYMGNELGEVRIPPYLFVVYQKVYLMMKKKSSRFLKKLGTDHPAPPTHKYFLRNSQS